MPFVVFSNDRGSLMLGKVQGDLCLDTMGCCENEVGMYS